MTWPLLLAIVTLSTEQSTAARAPQRCELTRASATAAWQGTCGAVFGQTSAVAMMLTNLPALESGMLRSDQKPLRTYKGTIKGGPGEQDIEVELYGNQSGVIRTQGGWFTIVDVIESANRLAFRIDDSKPFAGTDLDRAIIERASKILSDERVWDRADDRKCAPDDKTWSIYCAMERASREVTGGFHHRRPALEAVRQIVDARSAGRNYSHRLMDYNNDKTTTLADVQSLFKEALARMPR
jgi:hypothetical protein